MLLLAVFNIDWLIAKRLQTLISVSLLRTIQFMLLYHASKLFLSFGHVLIHAMRILYLSFVLLNYFLLITPPLSQMMIQTSIIFFLLSHISPEFYTLLSVLSCIMYFLLIHSSVLISPRPALFKAYLHS